MSAELIPDPPIPVPPFDDERKALFLSYLADTGALATACRYAGVSYSTVRRHREEDPDFGDAVEFHLQLSREAVELEARRRALEGVEEPVLYAGAPVWTEVRDEEGRVVHRPALDPETREPIEDPVTGRLRMEPVLRPVTQVQRSDRLLVKLLEGDPKFQKSTVQHTHQHNHQVGVMLIPQAPTSEAEWETQLSGDPVPDLLQEAPREHPDLVSIDADFLIEEEEDIVDPLCFDFLEG